MDKFTAILDLFRKGKEVADVEKWKQHQVNANAVGGLILAVLLVLKLFFNIAVPVDENLALMVGGVIVAIVNGILTMVTSKRAGVLPEKVEAPKAADPVQAVVDAAADKVEQAVVDKAKQIKDLYLG